MLTDDAAAVTLNLSRSNELETERRRRDFTNDRPCRRIPMPDWFCLGLTASKSSSPHVLSAWATNEESGSLSKTEQQDDDGS